MKLTLFALMISFGFAVSAQNISFIDCKDLNQKLPAPVYVEITPQQKYSPIPLEFNLGNEVSYSGIPGRVRSATVLGKVESKQIQDSVLTLHGSFGSTLVLDLISGKGLVTGFVKYNPSTANTNGVKLLNYPVLCQYR